MDYPYKYIVIVSESDSYSEFEKVYKFCDLEDAMKLFNLSKELNCTSALYRIGQKFGFDK